MLLASVPPLAYAYAGSVLAVALLSAWLARYAWNGRDSPGATSLAVLMVGVCVWNACTAVQLVVPDRTVVMALETVVHGSVGVAVAGFFGLGLEYSGREDLLDRRAVATLAVEPAAIVILSATNPLHGLVWESFEVSTAALDTASAELGTVFWLHTFYNYGLIVAGLVLVGHLVVRWQSIYKMQAAVVFVGAFVPLVVNVVSLARPVPIDVQPVAFAVTGVATAWAIRRYRLVDIVPIAREHVVQTLSDPVIVLDDRGRITDVNPATAELLGASGGDLVGRTPGDVFEDVPGSSDALDAIVGTDEQVDLHVQVSNRHFDVRGTPLTDERGDRRGTVVLFHDVTERETHRRELEHQNEQLERFASVVSHDLRNPLSVAEGYLPLARESGEEEHFEAVEESFERMNAIIDDVLTMAREGSQVEEVREVSLASIAATAWDQVDTGDAELVVADDVAIDADPNRLQRLLENLFRNAVEHGDGADRDGSGTLTVTVGRIQPGGASTLRGAEEFGFYVEDDGVGIPAAIREEIFEPGHSSSSGGTGLGLSIVQGIAEAHGWTVRATEAENGGARFEIVGAPPAGHPAVRLDSASDGAQR